MSHLEEVRITQEGVKFLKNFSIILENDETLNR